MRNERYWYFDGAPISHLGLTKKDIVEKGNYVIVAVEGSLEKITELCNHLPDILRKTGRKLVKDEDFVEASYQSLIPAIKNNYLSITGSIFWHSKTPEIVRLNGEYYQADVSYEKGFSGMQSRAFAQLNWCLLQYKVVNKKFSTYPIVCVDNENKLVWKPMGVHFYRQIPKDKGEMKVESQGILELIGKEKIYVKKTHALKNEKTGHKLVDYLVSMLLNKSIDPEFPTSEFFNYIRQYNSYIEVKKFDSVNNTLNLNFKTELVGSWATSTL